MTIVIIDLGVGNIASLSNALIYTGVELVIASSGAEFMGTKPSGIILPGVGAAGSVLDAIDERGFRSGLDAMVQVSKVPFLGICVGAQIITESCEEFGQANAGLGWVPGYSSTMTVNRMFPLPHMGWNDLEIQHEGKLFRDLNGSLMYFAHSCSIKTDKSYNIASMSYGEDYTAAISNGNIFGVQFHPEKSGSAGESLLKNFIGVCY